MRKIAALVLLTSFVLCPVSIAELQLTLDAVLTRLKQGIR